ncbi:polymeric immunoglobulin receptor-like [Rhinophrynus dorsalis]
MATTMFFFSLIFVLIIHNTESKQLACPKQVTGIVDGSITIKCSYNLLTKANKYERKFLCREGRSLKYCDTIISTNYYIRKDFRNRASIVDNPAEGTITIQLSGLQMNDEGTYRCGIGNVGNGLTAVINVAVTEDSTIPEEAELIYSQLRGTVSFNCKFGEQYSKLRKYLCKIGKNDCRNIIDSTGHIATEHQGRIILSNRDEPGSFSVKLIQLRNDDSGLYACGFGSYGGDGDSDVFDLRINEETDIPQGSRMLTSSPGGSVSALCHYNPRKSYTQKFWCKWNEQQCQPLINTDGFVQDLFEGRLLIHDNPTNGTMQVLMNQMTKDDEGWYWCVMTDGLNDQTSAIHFKIAEESRIGLFSNKTVLASLGKPTRIPCSYACRYTSYQKYWCKWNNFGCDPMTFKDDEQDGLSVSCESRELVLIISAVTKKDEGLYWCGVRKSERYGETIAVHLIVQEVKEEDTIGNLDTDAPNERRFNPGGDTRNSELDNDPPSSEEPKPNTIVIALSVSAVVLLVSAAVFFIIRLKKRRNSDIVSIGSYRTNISMTEIENDPYLCKDNPIATDAQETNLGSMEDESKTNNKESREELDYSSFLIHHKGNPNHDHA